MLRAHDILSRGSWDEAAAADAVVLELEDRRRRRLAMRGEKGVSFILDLAEVPALHDGDALVLSDGRLVAVRAAPERLIEITTADPADLVRIAWHLGNRHLPTELRPGALRIREDHVIADMVRRLGAEVRRLAAPFDPEGGAYHHHGPGGGGHAH